MLWVWGRIQVQLLFPGGLLTMGKWIGVALDGTLSRAGGMPEFMIGAPIGPMVSKVRRWLEAGQEVRVLTPRGACFVDRIRVRLWLDEHGLEAVGITASVDKDLQELWDDRAVRVSPDSHQGCPDCISSRYRYWPTPAGLSPMARRQWLSR